MNVACHRQREAAIECALHGIGQSNRSLRIDVVEILDDRERLRDSGTVVVEGGHQTHRIHAEINRIALGFFEQVHRNDVVIEPLQIQRNPHAIRGGRAKVRVELHRSRIRSSEKETGQKPRSSDGASGEIRTPGPQVRSLVLYPTELRTHKAAYYLDGVQGSQGNRLHMEKARSDEEKQFHGWRLIARDHGGDRRARGHQRRGQLAGAAMTAVRAANIIARRCGSRPAPSRRLPLRPDFECPHRDIRLRRWPAGHGVRPARSARGDRIRR